MSVSKLDGQQNTGSHWKSSSQWKIPSTVDSILHPKLTPETISNKEASLSVYPARGGIVTSLVLDGTEILYQGMLDETLYDTSKSVKGWIPMLFPNAWPLSEKAKKISWYTLPQHGFARTNQWQLGTKTQHQIQQSLVSKDVIDTWSFPFDGTINNTIILDTPKSCFFEYTFINNSQNSLSVAFWLHPYFDIPEWNKEDIEWLFKWGEQIKNEIENWKNNGTTLLDIPEDKIIKFKIPWVGTITIEVSEDFKRLWIWSLPGKNFVCVEPVFWDQDTIVHKNCVKIPWESSLKSSMRISLEK
jgi:galactose mutarotase-like enzyme